MPYSRAEMLSCRPLGWGNRLRSTGTSRLNAKSVNRSHLRRVRCPIRGEPLRSTSVIVAALGSTAHRRDFQPEVQVKAGCLFNGTRLCSAVQTHLSSTIRRRPNILNTSDTQKWCSARCRRLLSNPSAPDKPERKQTCPHESHRHRLRNRTGAYGQRVRTGVVAGAAVRRERCEKRLIGNIELRSENRLKRTGVAGHAIHRESIDLK